MAFNAIKCIREIALIKAQVKDPVLQAQLIAPKEAELKAYAEESARQMTLAFNSAKKDK